MSVYPVFDIERISAWCTKDVAEFIAQENKKNASLELKTDFKLTIEGLDTKEKCAEAIKPFVDFITSNLPKDETYVNYISRITDPELQNKLWIARTFLFSQLMIFAVVILGNSTLYTEVFGEVNGKTVFQFMPNVAGELPNYQMGIFGSKTPTSDIDVGIQYIGPKTESTLHYILSVFENLFVAFTGKSSLAFDIEAYADLYLIRDNESKDYFYLDTGNLTQAEFETILPVAGLSIARNVLMDNTAATPTFNDIITDVNKVVSENAIITDKTYTDFETSIGTELFPVLQEPVWLSGSMVAMKDFLTKDYHGQRAKYYEAVLAAETKKFAVAPNVNAALTLTNAQRCELINLVGTALAYRMESYSAAPTITHVVRILQANKEAVDKYKTQPPSELCNKTTKSENPAYCAIGKYGFVMSILEQMGYMSRFYKHYCVGEHPDQAKCDKKMKKYGDRYVDGFMQYKKHIMISDVAKNVVEGAIQLATDNTTQKLTSEGGKRRRTRRSKVHRRKTSKHGRNRKRGGRTRK
jgi:hypothetical protein